MNDMNKQDWRRGTLGSLAAGVVGCALLHPTAIAGVATQQAFETPQAGADALVQALKASDETRLHAIFGTDSDKLLDSGDKQADSHNRALFETAYEESHRFEMAGSSLATLVVGRDQWPMPIPLVKDGGSWHFDTHKGEEEILARRIGRNELSTMKVCLAIVDAQREYATRDLDADGVPEYASHFVSRPGTRDGLYWPTAANEPPSPLGALLASAADEGYSAPGTSSLEPYHGYYYRILTHRGDHADGGALDYEIKGKLIGGFALLAYPARYGDSGIMTFLVSDDGAIYEKDLGKDTLNVATTISAFDPDASWKKADVAK